MSSEYHQCESVPPLLFQKPDYRMDTKPAMNSAILISSPTINGLPPYAPPQYNEAPIGFGPTQQYPVMTEPSGNAIHGPGSLIHTRVGEVPIEGFGDVDDGSPQKFKTKMCANFLSGNCQWGSRCAFAHGTQDLRQQVLSPVQSQFSSNVYPQALAAKQPPPSYEEHAILSPTVLSPRHSLPTSPKARLPASIIRGAASAGGTTFPIGGPTTSVNLAAGQVGNSLPVTPTGAPPPSYPTRFRHSPYSPNSIQYTSEGSSRAASPFVNSPPSAMSTEPLMTPATTQAESLQQH